MELEMVIPHQCLCQEDFLRRVHSQTSMSLPAIGCDELGVCDGAKRLGTTCPCPRRRPESEVLVGCFVASVSEVSLAFCCVERVEQRLERQHRPPPLPRSYPGDSTVLVTENKTRVMMSTSWGRCDNSTDTGASSTQLRFHLKTPFQI